MSDRYYNSLSKEHQKIVTDAARTAILAGRGLSRIIDSSEKGLPVLQSRMKVYVPTARELKAFRDKDIPSARAFLVKIYKKEGEYWVDKFLKEIARAEKKLGY